MRMTGSPPEDKASDLGHKSGGMKEEREDHTFQTGSYNIELKINSPLFFASGQPTLAQ